MKDIVSVADDIGLYDTQTVRAANILSVQLGALEYAREIGIDLEYFLDDRFSFQNESFKAYLVERLANSSINVSTVMETVESLYTTYSFEISSDENNTGLIAR